MQIAKPDKKMIESVGSFTKRKTLFNYPTIQFEDTQEEWESLRRLESDREPISKEYQNQ